MNRSALAHDSTTFGTRKPARAAFLVALSLLLLAGQPLAAAMPRYASDVDRADWMSEVFATRSNFLLSDIVIPGSHDTGTYGIDCNSAYEAGSDASAFNDPVIQTILGLFGVSVKCYIAGLSKTQDKTVAQQLSDGIRYLDFRVNVNGSNFVLTHLLEGISLASALGDLASFAAAHPKEIIILEIGKVPSSSYINSFNSMIDSYLGDYLFPDPGKYLAYMTVEDVWSSGKNIIMIVSDGTYAASSNNYFAGGTHVQNNWSNTDDPNYLVTNQKSGINPREIGKLTKTSLIMTWKGLSSCNPLDGCWTLRDMADWVKGYSRTYVPAWIDEGLRPNLVLADFYEDTALVDVAIEENLTRAFGDMKITAAWSTGYCLDAAGTNPIATDTNIGLYSCEDVTETWTYDYGDRKIHTGWDHNICLDVAGENIDTNGRNIQIHPCGNVHETWFYKNDDKQFHSLWGTTDRCINVVGDKGEQNNLNVETYACGNVTESWLLGATAKIVADWDHDICLDATGTEETTKGEILQAWYCDAAETESWLYSLSDGLLHAAWDTSLCVDLAGRRPTYPTGSVEMWDDCTAANEVWRYSYTDQQLHAQWDDTLCLAISGSQTSTGGAAAELDYCDDAYAEPFLMIGADAAPLVSKWSNGDFCLVAQSTANGGIVATGLCSAGGLDDWVLNPVDGKVHAGWNLDYCLDVAGVNLSDNGRTIGLWQCDQVSETWRYTAPGRLQARWAPWMCLDVEGDNPTTSGAKARLTSCANGTVEDWQYPY